MSKHNFTTVQNGETISIMMGWDKPLQGYFMVIEKQNSDEDEPFWSNLIHHEPAHPKTLNSFLSALETLGIVIPQPMIDEILSDGAMNIGNKVVHHFFDNGLYKRVSNT